MQLLGKILLSPIAGPIWTAGFVIKRINEQVENEYLDEGKVQADLLELTLQYERGEIDDEEYQDREAAILDHLNDIRARTGQVDEAENDVGDGAEDEAIEEQAEEPVDEASEEPVEEAAEETSEE